MLVVAVVIVIVIVIVLVVVVVECYCFLINITVGDLQVRLLVPVSTGSLFSAKTVLLLGSRHHLAIGVVVIATFGSTQNV